MNVLGIYREKIFSPGKIEQDKAIMDKVLSGLKNLGVNVRAVSAESAFDELQPDLVLSMAQAEDILSFLSKWEKEGVRIINSTQSVKNCYRKKMIAILKEHHIPMPKSWIYSLEAIEEELSEVYSFGWIGSYWIKRGDFHALQKEDVVCVSSFEEMEKAVAYFREKDVNNIVIQEHVDGDTVKFYGVGDSYIRSFLSLTSEPFELPEKAIKAILDAKNCLGLEVYGGDLVISNDDFFIIDINDWPSFSLCQDEAADKIVRYVKSVLEGK